MRSCSTFNKGGSLLLNFSQKPAKMLAPKHWPFVELLIEQNNLRFSEGSVGSVSELPQVSANLRFTLLHGATRLDLIAPLWCICNK